MALEDALQALKKPIALLERETQLQLQHEKAMHIRALHDERSFAISAHAGSMPSDRGGQQLSDSVAAAYEKLQLEMTAAKSELVYKSEQMLLQLESTRYQTSAMSRGVGVLEHQVAVTKEEATSRCNQLEATIEKQGTQYAQELERLRTQLARMEAQHAHGMEQVVSLRQALDLERQRHDTTMRELEATVEKYRSEKTQTQHRLRDLETATEQYRNDIEEAGAEKTALLAEQQATLRELEQHREQVVILKRERAQLEAKHCDDLASVKEAHAEQQERQRNEIASVKKEHQELLQHERAQLEAKHCDDLASVKEAHAEQQERQRNEIACVKKEQQERQRNEIASLKKEHQELLQRERAQLEAKHCGDLASVKEAHAEQQERQRNEIASVKKEHQELLARAQAELSVQLQNHQAEMLTEHEEQVQRHKRSAEETAALLVQTQSALDLETERLVDLKMQLTQATAARDTAEADLKMQMTRAQAAQETAKAEHDSSREVQRDIHASSQDVQLLQRRTNDLQFSNPAPIKTASQLQSELAAENERLRAKVVEQQQPLPLRARTSSTVQQMNAQRSDLTAPLKGTSTSTIEQHVGSGGGQWLADRRGAIDRHRHARQESPAPLFHAPSQQPDLNRLV